MKRNRLKALIDLLDDPDILVYQSVEKELLKENHNIIPVLEKKWEDSFDENCQDRIENIIRNIHFKEIKKGLKSWINAKGNNLLDGFIFIDRFQYPDLNLISINYKLEQIKKSVWIELNDSLTTLEKTTVLNHFLFNINGFSLNHDNPGMPQNCFLNQLLDTKKGNPVSLAIFYTILARDLGLPARFTDFPQNPLVAIVDSEIAKKVHGKYSRSDVLYYINPGNKGSITNRREIDYHLKKYKYLPLDDFAEPAPDTLFIFRLLEILRNCFHSAGLIEKESRTEELMRLFKKEINKV
jgi:hypothetical protein